MPVQVVVIPSQTPTVPTVSPTRTFTPTPTSTGVLTHTPTLTLTPTSTYTPSVTRTPSLTRTPTLTPTSTRTFPAGTPTYTFTQTPAITPTTTPVLRKEIQVIAGPTATPPICVCDCDNDGVVSALELQTCLNILLGQPLSLCPACDSNHDGIVNNGDISRCITSQLGCVAPTPSRTPSLTQTPTLTATATATQATPTGAIPPTATAIPTRGRFAAIQIAMGTALPTDTPTSVGGTATRTPTPTPTRTFTPLPSPTNRLPCCGDCNGNGVVSALEVQTCLNIMEGASLSLCPACDCFGHGTVGIPEIQIITSFSLNGCPVVQGCCNCDAIQTQCVQAANGACPPGCGTPVPGQNCLP